MTRDELRQNLQAALLHSNLRELEELSKKIQILTDKEISDGNLFACLPWREIFKKSEQPEASLSTWSNNVPERISVGLLKHEHLRKKKNTNQASKSLETIEIPALVKFRETNGILIASDQKRGLNLLRSITARVLLTTPNSLVNLHIFDTLNFGKNFSFISRGLGEQTNIITKQLELGSLIESLEERIMSLGANRLDENEWLYRWNEKNHETAEAYHFVVIHDYSSQVKNETKERLKRIIHNNNAAKSGIYLLISTDATFFSHEDLQGFTKIISGSSKQLEIVEGGKFDTSDKGNLANLYLDEETTTKGTEKLISSQLEAKFAQQKTAVVKIQIPENTYWTMSSETNLTIPIGKSGSEQISLILNSSTEANALVGGAVGTGKSVLLHNIIINSACLYSPEEVEMVLLDYKEGTEFSVYEKLPHIKALSLSSQKEFGLETLRWLQEDLEHRATLFKHAAVTSLPDYRQKTKKSLARRLIVIDEFQVLMNDDSSEILENLIRKGRAYGYNFVLSSQSLHGVEISRPTYANIKVRISLRLSEEDSESFLEFGNCAPASFERTGQAVYNSELGRKKDNREFQVAFIEQDLISEKVLSLAESLKTNNSKPSIFRGDCYFDPLDLDELTEHIGSINLGGRIGIPTVPILINLNQKEAKRILVTGTGKKIDGFFTKVTEQLASKDITLYHIEKFGKAHPDSLRIEHIDELRNSPSDSNMRALLLWNLEAHKDLSTLNSDGEDFFKLLHENNIHLFIFSSGTRNLKDALETEEINILGPVNDIFNHYLLLDENEFFLLNEASVNIDAFRLSKYSAIYWEREFPQNALKFNIIK